MSQCRLFVFILFSVIKFTDPSITLIFLYNSASEFSFLISVFVFLVLKISYNCLIPFISLWRLSFHSFQEFLLLLIKVFSYQLLSTQSDSFNICHLSVNVILFLVLLTCYSMLMYVVISHASWNFSSSSYANFELYQKHYECYNMTLLSLLLILWRMLSFSFNLVVESESFSPQLLTSFLFCFVLFFDCFNVSSISKVFLSAIQIYLVHCVTQWPV